MTMTQTQTQTDPAAASDPIQANPQPPTAARARPKTRSRRKKRPMFVLNIYSDMGTQAAMDECQELLGPDELGRPCPYYAVAHLAVTELRDRLRRDQKRREPSTGDRGSGSAK